MHNTRLLAFRALGTTTLVLPIQKSVNSASFSYKEVHSVGRSVDHEKRLFNLTINKKR